MSRSTPSSRSRPTRCGSIRSAPEAGDAVDEDPELTVDASPELVDVIRAEIARRDATAGDGAPPSDDPTPNAAKPMPSTNASTEVAAPHVAAATPPPETPPPGSGRWQPQQRLAARAPVIATTPIVRTDNHHRTKDSTKIILAAIAATVIVAVAWLLVGGETADAPPSIDTLTTVEGTQPSSGVTTPASTPP